MNLKPTFLQSEVRFNIIFILSRGRSAVSILLCQLNRPNLDFFFSSLKKWETVVGGGAAGVPLFAVTSYSLIPFSLGWRVAEGID